MCHDIKIINICLNSSNITVNAIIRDKIKIK